MKHSPGRHFGDFSNASVLGTLAGVEMGLKATGIPYGKGGVDVAIDVLSGNSPPVAHATE
jgi:alanine-glyoxylate transaminase/serine-glyoxylate transaminase/serine-pyruvate transaminase